MQINTDQLVILFLYLLYRLTSNGVFFNQGTTGIAGVVGEPGNPGIPGLYGLVGPPGDMVCLCNKACRSHANHNTENKIRKHATDQATPPR